MVIFVTPQIHMYYSIYLSESIVIEGYFGVILQ